MQDDFEVVVVDQQSSDAGMLLADISIPVRVIYVLPPLDGGFNKGRLLNAGIELTDGEVVTFLDADAIVGPRWLEGALFLTRNPALTRLCYRVKRLPETILAEFEGPRPWRDVYAELFLDYESKKFANAYEAYQAPEHGAWAAGDLPEPVGPHVFGNSQFSIRREKLADLRFDAEHYPRAGYEDLEFLRRIAERYGSRYQAQILRDGPHAMFHITNQREPDWHEAAQNSRQRERYFAKKPN